MIKDAACMFCRFAHPSAHPSGDPGQLEDRNYECRRHAPRPRIKDLRKTDDNSEWSWPVVSFDHWCAEFSKAHDQAELVKAFDLAEAA